MPPGTAASSMPTPTKPVWSGSWPEPPPQMTATLRVPPPPARRTKLGPRGTELLAFEGEVAVIVGRRARHVAPEQGAEHIGWYAPANDVGVYDLRWADAGSNLLSKGQDGFTPIGPAAPAAEVNGAALV